VIKINLPTLTLANPVKHGEFYATNGRLFRWNAVTQHGEMILDIEAYVANEKVNNNDSNIQL
jgi:hypothetical protein